MGGLDRALRVCRGWLFSRRLRGPGFGAHERGVLGERIAWETLERGGMVCLTRNFRGKRGEIDLIARDDDCLVFVEVKTRSEASWTRPAAAVHREKWRRLLLTAQEYVLRLPDSRVRWRFDIVEVVLDGAQGPRVTHLRNVLPPVAINQRRR